MKPATTKRSGDAVAEIALYGTTRVGGGFIATTADGRMFGDGEPRKWWSMTEALWMAVEALRSAGVRAGRCVVHVDFPSGPRAAAVDLGRHVPAFGSLEWGPGVTYSVSADQIQAAAE